MADRLAGRYELVRVIGQGAGSLVWRARDDRLDRDVAVKTPLDASDRQLCEKLFDEASVAARFSHPNTVAVFDVVDGDEVFIVMELVEGESLASKLARDGPIPADQAVRIVGQVLDALEAVHAGGFVHRDVKPSNILIDRHGDAKLTDFGIATAALPASRSSEPAREVVGSVQYLSPEVMAGRPATAASDVYAVGVVLYEMLAGRPPFVGASPASVALAHRDVSAPSIREHASDVPPQVADAVDRALHKREQARFVDAASMRRSLADESLSAVARTSVLDLPALTTEEVVADRSVEPSAGATGRGLALAAAVAVAVLLGWLIGSRGALIGDAINGQDPAAAPDAANQAELSPSSTSPTPTITTSTQPTTSALDDAPTLGQLTDRIASAPDSYGEKSGDLLKQLQEIQREDMAKRANLAEKTIEDIEKWVDDGKLDRSLAEEVTRRLGSIEAGESP